MTPVVPSQVLAGIDVGVGPKPYGVKVIFKTYCELSVCYCCVSSFLRQS